MAFGERRSPPRAASLRMALHAHRMRPERTGFSPSAGTSARVSRRARYKQNRWYMVYQWFFAYGTMKVSAQIASYGHPSDPKPTQLCAWGWLL